MPSANPDVVPTTVSRNIEVVDPLCQATCTPTALDASVLTKGNCRLGTSSDTVAVCAAACPVHKVAQLLRVLPSVWPVTWPVF